MDGWTRLWSGDNGDRVLDMTLDSTLDRTHLLTVLIQDFIDEHIVIINRNLITDLLSEGQSNGVGLSSRVPAAALQVGVVEAPSPTQTSPKPIETQAWHQDQVQTS